MNLPIPAHTVSHLQLLRQSQIRVQEYKNDNELLRNENESLKHEIASFKHQLDWFKRHLFGEKSEKRLIDNPDQRALGEILEDIVPQPESETETITYEHRKKQRPEDSVTNQGLRFNGSVPVEVIHMPASEM